MYSRLVSVFLCLVCLLGCDRKPADVADPKAAWRGVTVSVWVPDRPELIAWLNDQRGEWSAQTGAAVELKKLPVTDGQPASLGQPSGDAIIFPASKMGELVAGAWIAELPKQISEDATHERKDLATAVLELCSWNRKPHAFALSAESVLVYYRQDLFVDDAMQIRFEQKFGRPLAPPATWSEFDELAQFFNGSDLDGDGEPDRSVVVGSLSESVIARAAAYGKVRQNLSCFFDVNTMEPLIAGPAFQQALEDWTRLAPCIAVPEPDRESLPSEEGAAPLLTLKQGKAALGVGSSRLARSLFFSRAAAGPSTRVVIACAPLPGARRAYLHDQQLWVDSLEKPNRSALVDGLLASTIRKSPNTDAAADLLNFLSNRERSLSSVTTPAYPFGPFRQSHLVDEAVWHSSGWPRGTTATFLDAMRQSLSEPNAVMTLRVFGSRTYLSALESAVRRAMDGETSPTEALDAAAQDWRTITEKLGADRQRRQYRYSLGVPVIN